MYHYTYMLAFVCTFLSTKLSTTFTQLLIAVIHLCVCRSSVILSMGHILAHIQVTCAKADPSTGLIADDSEGAKQASSEGSSKKESSVDDDDNDDDEERDSRSTEDAENEEGSSGGSSQASSNKAFKTSKNVTQLTRVRDSILNILIERTHDKNFSTRATVLKAWSSLLEASAVPLRFYGTVCDIALDRAVDKTAIVRKSAIALLVSLLDNNPFGGSLDLEAFTNMRTMVEENIINRLDVLKNMLYPGDALNQSILGLGAKKTKHLGVILEEDEDEDGEDEDDNEDDEDEETRNIILEMVETKNKEFLQSDDVKNDSDMKEYRAKLDFARDAIRLIEAMKRGLVLIEDMIFSKTTTDVGESLLFISRAVNFGIPGSAKCLQKYVYFLFNLPSSLILFIIFLLSSTSQGLLPRLASRARHQERMSDRFLQRLPDGRFHRLGTDTSVPDRHDAEFDQASRHV